MESKRYKININNHIRIDGHALYILTIENINTGTIITFNENYTKLRNLYELMRKEASSKNFPQFPPKKLFGYDDEKFVVKREKELNAFFEEINKNEKFSKLPSLIKYIEENIEKNPNIRASKIIRYSARIQFHNKNILDNPTEFKRLSPAEYKKQFEECKKIVNEYNDKFVSLDYDIEIKGINNKKEKKYEKLINEENILLNKDNNNNDKIEKGNDENFNYIGKDEENFKNIENTINSMIEKNMDKYNNLSSMIELNDFLLN